MFWYILCLLLNPVAKNMVCDTFSVETFSFPTGFKPHSGEKSACHCKSFTQKEVKKYHDKTRLFDLPLKEVLWPPRWELPSSIPTRAMILHHKQKVHSTPYSEWHCTHCLSLPFLPPPNSTDAQRFHYLFCSSHLYDILCK